MESLDCPLLLTVTSEQEKCHQGNRNNLSGHERQERLIEFLGLFARRDAIRDNQFEFATDSDSETSSSDNENEKNMFITENYNLHLIKLSLSIPNIFFFLKSDL